ncbi:unnamed protein product [Cyclocybe aegerita]|uniref:RRM domain-containing protein n=1 Tax=Cyclocybe aegerita TaxID=1973307 RepID=A0A8S0XDZ2_CYCAE|nr:unnamed protein product [Cyclocybe aegerita]
MSRPESQEYEFPPGLGAQRPRPNERDQPVSYAPAALGSFAHQDRRSSSGAASFAAFGGGLPRSYGMQDPRDYAYGISLPEIPAGPNRHNPTPSLAHLTGSSSFSTFNHHNHRPSPPPLPANAQSAPGAAYPSSSPSDRDTLFFRSPQASHPQQPASNSSLRSTLWWGALEPWMDEEYAKQVCGLMNWEPVTIKVPHAAADPTNSQQQANNPGYCFLTFPSPAHAASVLAQINNGGNSGKGMAAPMPNSSKPFVMNWASSVATASPMSAAFPASTGVQAAAPAGQQYPKEYSIFVGDLAPETSNSDLVAVFRNPVLGLRNDREPKFIRPFLSCKSAKIMLDPLTGVSRGYGFVRFTDEADQQRALIEMHGLYCLSRPMRISPATAKFKPPASVSPFDMPQVPFVPPGNNGATEGGNQAVTIAVPLNNAPPIKSVSAPIAAAPSNMSLNSNTVSNSTSGSSLSSNSLTSGTGSSTSISTSAFSAEDIMGVPNNVLAQLAQFTTNDLHPIKMASANPHAHDDELRRVLAHQTDNPAPRYVISEESWKHHAQARAILGNLIGPNGEQLTSTDPYNTTVFVGGLSPLISEDTLRTFFAPFGDIHYVKVPVGKHCGFVQFVRKADAERAIDKMQGFPIGGSRIRLSWGRSQYKAAQAAAQAAQAAAMQSNYMPAPGSITQDQAMQILQKLALQGYPTSGSYDSADVENALLNNGYNGSMLHSEQKPSKDEGPSSMNSFPQRPELQRTQSNFSPFSPDPNSLYTSSESVRRDQNSSSYPRLDTLPHPSKAYAPGFFPQHSQDLRINTSANGPNTSKVSPVAARPSSASRYGFAESSDPPARAMGRSEAPISRPSSGQMSAPVDNHESDVIQDLNGTLASLDLDRPWKSPEVGKNSG